MELSTLEEQLLNSYQRDFPLVSNPFEEIARQFGIEEKKVLEILDHLQNEEVISRVGTILQPNRAGVSCLAAMSVPEEKLNETAQLINSFQEVNHNYEREHVYNLWFVVIASSQRHLRSVLDRMEEITGFSALCLPMLKEYHIDLGFKL